MRQAEKMILLQAWTLSQQHIRKAVCLAEFLLFTVTVAIPLIIRPQFSVKDFEGSRNTYCHNLNQKLAHEFVRAFVFLVKLVSMQSMSGTLYIVPTPIGNLEDITLRAIRVLKEVDLVLCEDTSVTQKLFKTHNITTPTTVFYANTGIKNIEKIMHQLEEGKSLALVSDAGTPTISDPGVLLVDKIYKELPEVKVVALPGASALTTALSLSGVSSANFVFYGFLPHKKGRETIFKKIETAITTSVFYESVHRIEKTLDSLVEVLDPSRTVAVLRELTKIHEEVIRGEASMVRDYFRDNSDKVKGEFVVVVSA
jgi:16S rRNA (cytidine1402-2'-O)-methyltransferase